MRLVKGKELTGQQRGEVLRTYVHRNTVTQPCDVVGVPASGTDDSWLAEHAFYIKNDGHLASSPGHCEPEYLADEYNNWSSLA